MNYDTLVLIGRKLKEIRIQKKIKLIELAAKANISKGLLSQIENNRTIPSVPILLRIIQELEMDYSFFFKEVESQSSRQILHVKKEQYMHMIKEESIGYNYQFILSKIIQNIDIQFNILELQPGAQREKLKTDGYFYVYVLDGSVEYLLGEIAYHLQQGDSLFFNGAIPHVPFNKGDKTIKLLVLYLLNIT